MMGFLLAFGCLAAVRFIWWLFVGRREAASHAAVMRTLVERERDEARSALVVTHTVARNAAEEAAVAKLEILDWKAAFKGQGLELKEALDRLTLAKLARDAAGSVMLDLQQECIARTKERDEALMTVAHLEALAEDDSRDWDACEEHMRRAQADHEAQLTMGRAETSHNG